MTEDKTDLSGNVSAENLPTTNDMGRFLRKLGLRLLVLALFWVLFTQLMPRRMYLGTEYARWETVFAKIEALKSDPEHINLVMGDSRPEMGLASKHLGAWNLGLGGTSPVEGYYMLRQLAGVPIDTIYMSYSPYHFHAQDCFHNRTEYFGFVEQGYIDSVMAYSRSQADTTFAWNNWAWLDDLDQNYPSPWIRRQLRYLPSMHSLDNYGWYFQAYADMQARLEAEQLSYLFPSNICPGDTTVQEYYLERKTGGFVPNVVNAHYFQQMLSLIAQRHITLVWINMPLNRAIRQPSERYYADFEAWLRPQLPSGAPYIPLAFQDSCDFKDFSHLDADAAQAFGLQIKDWLKK